MPSDNSISYLCHNVLLRLTELKNQLRELYQEEASILAWQNAALPAGCSGAHFHDRPDFDCALQKIVHLSEY
jgi:hypothetical protein